MRAGSRHAEHGHPRSRAKTVLFAAIVLALCPSISAFAASITVAEGRVLFLKSGSYTWGQISVGQRLDAGDQLKTADGSRATVAFDDGSRVELNPGAAFTLQQSGPAAAEIKLSIGSLRAWVTKSLSRRFSVRTPTAVCSVRGTEFAVEVGERGDTNVQMFSGLLAVSDRAGNEVLVRDSDRIGVTSAGLGRVEDAKNKGADTGAAVDSARELAKREVSLEMSKEEVQAAAALEAKTAIYKEGKALVDVNGDRVRVEGYIMKPAADQFKLVILNERPDRFDYFFYHGTFNTTLPGDLSVALRQLPGCIGTACQYYLTSYRTGRSNTIDNMLEVTSGGHQVDINNNAYGTGDDVTAAFDPATQSFLTLAAGTPFYKTLFDNYTLTFNGVQHGAWSGTNIQNMVDGQPLAPTFASGGTNTTLTYDPACAPPNCTYKEDGVLHEVFYAENAGGTTWEKYDNYIISNEGKIARTADFGGATSGTAYKANLLNWNFQTIVTASEFQGRKIDLVVEPKLFVQSGLIQ